MDREIGKRAGMKVIEALLERYRSGQSEAETGGAVDRILCHCPMASEACGSLPLWSRSIDS
jgi:hypothetical protein